MQTLRFYNDITTAAEKDFGGSGVTFADVESFLASVADDEEEITLQINCRGGAVREALAIYDALRASGKKLSAEIVGECSSAATIILLAAPLERRSARPNASVLVHNPFICGMVQADSDQLRKIADDVDRDRSRFIAIYAERTKLTEEDAAALMAKDEPMSAQEALAKGFISSITAPTSAHNNFNTKSMAKSKNLSLFKAIGVALGVVKAMELTTADGSTLELEKEGGAPVVGDAVISPDGEYLMPDGSTIVVTDGVISEIKIPEETVVETETEASAEEEVTETVEVVENEESGTEVEELKKQLEEAEAAVEVLKKKLEEAEAKAKTAEDEEILKAVAINGGKNWLANVSSSYKAKAGSFSEKKAETHAASFREYYETRNK